MTTQNPPKAIKDMTVTELRAELELTSKEAYDAERKVESLLMERARWERETAAAIRRAEWEQVQFRGEQAARQRAAQALQPLEGVLYRVEQLGDRATVSQVTDLKQAVRDARFRLGGLVTTVEITPPAGAEAEAERLRAYVMAQGRALHADTSTGDLPCRCRGCELIRGMDAGAPSVDAALARPGPAT